MQPNSTNILLLQLVQNTAPNAAIPPVTGSVTTPTWFEGFAYVALSFSLLAAFGAVLGKQWLSHYKCSDVHGSREERGKLRQQKLDALEAWRFHAVLQSFPVLLQISLLLFGLALSAFVWSQQGPLAVAVIVPAAFGILFYAYIIFASLKYLQCPFETPISTLIRLLWRRFRLLKIRYRCSTGEQSPPDTGEQSPPDTGAQSPLAPDTGEVEETTASMKWIFETSTDPEVISSVAWLLPTTKLAPEFDMKTVWTRLLNTFKTCFHGFQLSVSARDKALACGRALHHVICDDTTEKSNLSNDLDNDKDALDMWSRWHDIAYPWGFWDCKLSFDRYAMTQHLEHRKEARNALRLAIVTGCPGFMKSTDVALIWDGAFDWTGDTRTPEDFDWLVDFLMHFRKHSGRDLDAMADALLALSAMRGLGSPAKRDIYFDSIIFSMEADKPFRLRHAALRAVFDARLALVDIADSKEGEFREQLLTKLPSALFTTTRLITPSRTLNDPDDIFNPGRDYFYLRLIFSLAKQEDWRAQLEAAGHVDRCLTLLGHVIDMENDSIGSSDTVKNHAYYLAAALIRMDASDSYQTSSFASGITESEWWKLLKGAWWAMGSNRLYREEESREALEALPDIAKYTLESLKTQAAIYDAKSLVRWVDRIYKGLKDGAAEAHIISAVESVKDALDSSIS